MPLERLKSARKKSIGSKQTAKAIEKGSVRTVFVARDADEHVTREIVKIAREQGLELVLVDSMTVLGKACGIEVDAAVAAILDA
jgi:large subunit ribosomal protein L7A